VFIRPSAARTPKESATHRDDAPAECVARAFGITNVIPIAGLARSQAPGVANRSFLAHRMPIGPRRHGNTSSFSKQCSVTNRFSAESRPPNNAPRLDGGVGEERGGRHGS